MKLTLLHPAFQAVGGAEVLAEAHARALLEAGVSLSLATMAFDPSRWADRLAGVDIKLFPRRHLLDLLAPWDRIGKIRRRARSAWPLFAGQDAVLAYNYPCNDMLGLAPEGPRKIWYCNEPPRGLHLHEANPRLSEALRRAPAGDGLALADFRGRARAYDRSVRKGGELAKRRAFDIRASRGLHRLIANSRFTLDNARRIYGLDGEVIPPIIRFPEERWAPRGIRAEALQILVQSRLESLKNIDTLLKGFARFRPKSPGATLHIAGEGRERPALEALAEELGLGTAVRFHGYLDAPSLAALQRQCEVFALLPFDEPFGMVFPEAAARGLLLIGPDHGGPLEILDGGRAGSAIDPLDPEAFAEALSRVASLSDAEAEARREAADRSCRARFSAEVLEPRLLKALVS